MILEVARLLEFTARHVELPGYRRYPGVYGLILIAHLKKAFEFPRMLGHSSTAIVQGYAKVFDEKCPEVFKKLEVLGESSLTVHAVNLIYVRGLIVQPVRAADS
jgi:hypothetical protein